MNVSPSSCSQAVESATLSNGLRVIVHPDHRMPLVAVHLSIRAGSRNEPAEHSGLAHLCEHLAFQGAGLPALIQARGGTAQGATSHDATRFGILLPKSELAFGLWAQARRLADTASHLKLLETQRRVLLQERRQRVERRPYGRAVEILQGLLYPEGHPYHHIAAGRLESLRAINEDDVRRFFDSYYRPNNADLVLVGDLTADRAFDAAERWLGPLPARQRPQHIVTTHKTLGERRATGVDRVPAPRVYLACRAPGWWQDGWRAACLWMDLLVTARSSPVKRRLIEESGIAHSVDGYLLAMDQATTLAIAATAEPGVDCDHLEQCLIETIDASLRQPVSPSTLHRARKKALKLHYFRTQGLNGRANFYTRLASRHGNPSEVDREAGRLQSMDSESLAAVGRTLFQPHDRALLSILPEAA